MTVPRISLAILVLALPAAGLAALLGCGQSDAAHSQAISKYRTSFALDDEPDGALTVAEVRELLSGVADDDHADHDEHADHDHSEADHDEHADHDHGDGEADHDHSADLSDDADEGDEAHAEHGHDDHEHAEHGDAEDEHAHDEDGHAHAEHAEHDHEGHDHAEHAHAHDSEPQEVVMVGLVGGLPNAAPETQPDFPFIKDYAIVTLADPAAVAELESDGHHHAPGEECAFCAAHAEDSSAMLATVKFTDENGKVLSVDARELFDLKLKDTVVVRGTARLDRGALIVDATALYVRK